MNTSMKFAAPLIRRWPAILMAAAGLMFAPAALQAQEDAQLDQVMEEISANADKLESWRADFQQEVSVAGMAIKSTGEMETKGTMSRGNITMDMMGQKVEMKTVTDQDNVAWIETNMAGQPMVMRMDMNSPAVQEMTGGQVPGGVGGGMANNPQQMLEMLRKMGEVSYQGKEELYGKQMHVLESKLNEKFLEEIDASGQMSQMGMRLDKMRLWVDPEFGFTRKVSFQDPQGTPVMQVEFTNFEPNVEVSDDAFTYTPPEGVPIVDMTQQLEEVEEEAPAVEPDAPADPDIEPHAGQDPEEGEE